MPFTLSIERQEGLRDHVVPIPCIVLVQNSLIEVRPYPFIGRTSIV